MVDEVDNGLDIDDLLNVLRMINTATERGAFKANELSFVGKIYDKFSTFVRAAQAEQAAADQEKQNGESSEDGGE